MIGPELPWGGEVADGYGGWRRKWDPWRRREGRRVGGMVGGERRDGWNRARARGGER